MKLAQLNLDRVVVALLSSNTIPEDCVIDDGNARIGYRFDGTNFSPQKWTSFQFLQRFTESELEIVRGRAVSDPIVWRFLTFAQAAQEVDGGDPMTIAGMDYLVAASILTQARRDEILAV